MTGRLRHIPISSVGNVATTLSPGAGKRWRLISARVVLVADATVVNRYIYIIPYMAAATILHPGWGSPAITAGQTKYFGLMGSVSVIGSATITDNFAMAIDTMAEIIEGTDYYSVSINAGVAGDAYTGVMSVIETPL